MEKKIKERVVALIERNDFEDIRQCVIEHGARAEEMKDAESIADWIMTAPMTAKMDFLNMDNSGIYECGLRVCTNCGKFMIEGYILPDFDYACSDECAIQNYIRDCHDADAEDGKITREQAEEMFQYDLENNDEDCYYTDWVMESF